MLAGRLGGPEGTPKVDTCELVNSTFHSRTLKGCRLLIMDILMGVGGAVAGEFLMRSVGFGGSGGRWLQTMVAMIRP